MSIRLTFAALLSPSLLVLASCAPSPAGDSVAGQPGAGASSETFVKEEHGSFAEPWAARFLPGTNMLFVTEKGGTAKIVDTDTDRTISVSGLPKVAYGGQGGLGDVAFLAAQSGADLTRRTIFLSWAEAGTGGTRGAAVGRGELVCEDAGACRIDNLAVIWRQDPKVGGSGHYSHRLALSPDGQYLFIASGDRQMGAPAQDTSNNLGSIVRLSLGGELPADNPLAASGGTSAQLWSWGHRNILGLRFDGEGRLWGLEHGPAGGDELNLIEKGGNYGWPTVSNGDNYNGSAIPRHSTRPDLSAPAISWSPVIAPGDFLFYSGKQFASWKGQAIIAGLKTEALIRVAIDGTKATEVGRIPMDRRIREVVEGPDGAIWVLEDGDGARLLKLTRAAS